MQLKATSGASSGPDEALRWESQLDTVLRDARTQVNAAAAQASVLLTGIVSATVLVLLVAADLLVRRHVPAITAARHRGAALPDLGAELFIESTAAALVATAVGLALARAVAPGVSVLTAVPLAVAAAIAAPAFGTLAAARATTDRRTPANRSARRWTRRTRRLRRAALDVALLVAAAGALVALHQRGIAPTGAASTPDASAGLPTSAPALGAVAVALLLLRLLPAGTRLALRQAMRSRRPLSVFGAARAATAGRVLPPLALVTATALASFALVLDATARQGVTDGSWRTVGADARLDVAPAAAASTPTLAARVAAAPGIDHVVVAQVTDRARVIADTVITAPRLVVVDTAAFRRLLAATPLPDVPALDRLADPAPGDVPALVLSGDGTLQPGMHLQLPQPDGAPAIRLTAVGTAPAIGDATDVVVVDTAGLAAAGLPTVPNTVWVTGVGTARAVATAGDATANVVLRADVERTRRAAPLTAGLLRLARTAAATLLALGLLGLALGAAGAPQRWQTLTRLRTLGLRPRDARWIAAGELLPAVLLAAVGGPLLGAALARLTLGPLEMRLLTRQAVDPALALPWGWLALLGAALLAAVAVVVPAEAALRRRRQLGEVLRAGE
ncbi:hypothetical protein GCM10027610_040990 [Dactylosporangium cerinum]